MPDGVKECGFCGLKFGSQSQQYGQPQYGGQNQQQMQSQYGGQNQQYGQPQYGGQSQQQMQPQYGGQSQQYGQTQYGNQSQQYVQSQYGQPQMMQFAGYDSRTQYNSQMKKGSTYIPNIINIIGMIMAVVALFLPYAQLSGDTRSIAGVFDFSVIAILTGAAVFLADIICAFVNNKVCYVVNLVISVVVGVLFMWELVLAIIDMGKLEAAVDAGLMLGAWFSGVTAVVLIASVPVWRTVTGKRTREDKS